MIINKDCLSGLKELENESINMCITSPPYWGLRDYGVDGQLGLEETFEEYINKLCDIFDEVNRVLRDDGTCWVNIGDTYSTTRWSNAPSTTGISQSHSDVVLNKKHDLPDKTLVGIPFRFAIEMINRGWILRNTIIWHKPNCMPSSVKDRFTVDFEYLFFFSKSKKYYFEQQFEPHQTIPCEKTTPKTASQNLTSSAKWKKERAYGANGRNMRTVWKISTKPYKGAHFAVFPPELIETPIKAGCPENGIVLDPFMGSGTTAMVAKQLGRKSIGFELNPEYIDLINERLKSVEKPLECFS